MRRGPRLRRLGAQCFFAAVIGLQLFFVVRAYDDPHHLFGYQPFSESSTWRATILRVTDSGRYDIRNGWAGYHWSQLVRGRGLTTPWVDGSAASGVESQLAFFQQALDWVATHTPNDRSTRYFEAHVRTVRNRGEPETRVMRSVERELPER